MLQVTLEGLSSCQTIDEILVVSEPNTLQKAKEIIVDSRLAKIKDVIPGGETRQQSSLLGLEHLASRNVDNNDIVLIVDGDRPCVEEDLVGRCCEAAKEVGACVPCLPVSDSILFSGDGQTVDRYVPRQSLYRVQTPQAFRFGMILDTARRHKDIPVTDDASLLRLDHLPVAITRGSEDNIKVTLPEDVSIYRLWKSKRS